MVLCWYYFMYLFIICLFMWNSASVNRTRCVCSDLDLLLTVCLGRTRHWTGNSHSQPVLRLWALYHFQKSNNKDVLYWEKHNHQTELNKCDLTISKEETRAYLHRSDEIYIVLNIDANTRTNCSSLLVYKHAKHISTVLMWIVHHLFLISTKKERQISSNTL